MLNLTRIGLFTRDTEQDYRQGSIGKLFRRAGIEFVDDPAAVAVGSFDLVIALGGDGTVLRALTAHPSTPVLGVNFGSVGFLTQSDRDQLDNLLVRLLADDYRIEDRLTLSVTHNGRTLRAINEAVLKAQIHMLELEIGVNGRIIHCPRGDGVIVGTPTGSTAYLLSTGAPIVTPEVDCFLIKPLNEYSLSSRSVVVPGSARISLTIKSSRDDAVSLVVDGSEVARLNVGDTVELARSPQPARLICFEEDYFFRNLRERLRW